jgi:hypothetical protein
MIRFDVHTWKGKVSTPRGGSTPVATKGSDSVVLVEAEDPKELVCVSLRGDTQRSRPASAGEDRSDISWEGGRKKIVLIEGKVLDRGRCSESVQAKFSEVEPKPYI